MNSYSYRYPYPNNYYAYPPMCTCANMYSPSYSERLYKPGYVNQYWGNQSIQDPTNNRITDHGKEPFVININRAAKQNNTFRTAIWTGSHLQVTLMSIDISDEIGLEVHPDVDQFLRIEEGQGLVQMGKDKNNLTYEKHVHDDSAIMVPAGTWHNLTNTGNIPLKLYSIYAPPEHPFDTVHRTKTEAMAAEEDR